VAVGWSFAAAGTILVGVEDGDDDFVGVDGEDLQGAGADLDSLTGRPLNDEHQGSSLHQPPRLRIRRSSRFVNSSHLDEFGAIPARGGVRGVAETIVPECIAGMWLRA
jgi:hypothetical protein